MEDLKTKIKREQYQNYHFESKVGFLIYSQSVRYITAKCQ